MHYYWRNFATNISENWALQQLSFFYCSFELNFFGLKAQSSRGHSANILEARIGDYYFVFSCRKRHTKTSEGHALLAVFFYSFVYNIHVEPIICVYVYVLSGNFGRQDLSGWTRRKRKTRGARCWGMDISEKSCLYVYAYSSLGHVIMRTMIFSGYKFLGKLG